AKASSTGMATRLPLVCKGRVRIPFMGCGFFGRWLPRAPVSAEPTARFAGGNPGVGELDSLGAVFRHERMFAKRMDYHAEGELPARHAVTKAYPNSVRQMRSELTTGYRRSGFSVNAKFEAGWAHSPSRIRFCLLTSNGSDVMPSTESRGSTFAP